MSEKTANEPSSPTVTRRNRESTGTAEKNQPPKRSKLDMSGDGKGSRKKRSKFLLLLTKGGQEYEHLEEDEYANVTKGIISAMFEKELEAPEIPHFDWASRPRGRSLIACDDENAVKWLKNFVSNFAEGYGAWLSDEGPNRRPFQVMVPYPTGDRTAEEIIGMASKANYLEGDL